MIVYGVGEEMDEDNRNRKIMVCMVSGISLPAITKNCQFCKPPPLHKYAIFIKICKKYANTLKCP